MTQGNSCPNCNESILSFGEFMKITNTNKSFYCENCGKELRLKSSFMILIFGAVIIGLAFPTFFFGAELLPGYFYNFSLLPGTLTVLLYLLLWVVTVSYLAWAFIGWKEVSSSDN